MQKQSSFQNDRPTLFLVATPIGNLQEMTPRALATLNNVQVIAAEDTRNTRKLLTHFSIKTKLITHHDFNQQESVDGILKLLAAGQDVALVSDAGFPLICDPGFLLVRQALAAQYNVVAVNGSSALLSALITSGMPTSPFYFHGFLPHNDPAAKQQLEELRHFPHTLVFYESVHRLKRTLSLMSEIFGDRLITLARELTKIYEEYFRGNISEILPELAELKGEFVIVVEGNPQNQPDVVLSDLRAQVDEFITAGYSASQAIKLVAKQANISKNRLYQYIHQA